MKKGSLNTNLLIKILSCLIIDIIIMNNHLSFFIIIPILVLIIIINLKVLKENKGENIEKNNKCTIYGYLMETMSLVYLFFLFEDFIIINRIIFCIVVNVLILFEDNIKKVNVMNKEISHDLIVVPFLILLLMSMPR